ncbi:rCG48813 [Rattus norvegicus]|uniref:RCG48813 n=1 Tax=Rattus norvegicus TaxID=10116 RepID=A6IGU5_RAT|nr:rCG48813 [Rattus norvegicus]
MMCLTQSSVRHVTLHKLCLCSAFGCCLTDVFWFWFYLCFDGVPSPFIWYRLAVHR